MPSHVALLRGINVGGRARVAMPELRSLVSSLGYTDVATYIQSGNVVFSTTRTDTTEMAADLERAIAETLGVQPRVVVLSRDELARVVADNPYPQEPSPKLVHAVFLSGEPEPDLVAGVATAQRQVRQTRSRDSAQLVGRTLFLHTPDGFGRSELATLLARLTERSAAVTGTARNWATVTKLLAMCDS